MPSLSHCMAMAVQQASMWKYHSSNELFITAQCQSAYPINLILRQESES